MQARNERENEAGFATIALVLVLVPMILVIGSYLQTMTERNQRLGLEIREEQAMCAAESGIDYALNEARRGTLVAGVGRQYTFTGNLTEGSSFTTTCVYLKGDSLDNDGDGAVDEADEDVFRVTCTGNTQTNRRRVAAYLGFSSYLPELEAAVTITNPATVITVSGSGIARGNNYALNGTLVGSGDTYGMAMAPPGTLAQLDAQLVGAERSNVIGVGVAPSIGAAAPIDVQQIVDFARNSASIVITNATVSSVNYGTSTSPVIVYREGDVRIQGNSTGYGLLVVNGTLRMAGTFRWYGVIVCTGTVEAATGNVQVHGGVLSGPASPQLTMTGNVDLRYSEAGTTLAANLTGRYVAFNGWQEISTNN